MRMHVHLHLYMYMAMSMFYCIRIRMCICICIIRGPVGRRCGLSVSGSGLGLTEHFGFRGKHADL